MALSRRSRYQATRQSTQAISSRRRSNQAQQAGKQQTPTLAKPARKGQAVCKQVISQLLLRPGGNSMLQQGQPTAHFIHSQCHWLQQVPV